MRKKQILQLKISGRIGLFLLPAFIIVSSCSQTEYPVFGEQKYIQFTDTISIQRTFLYKKENVIRDTVYIPVQLIGGLYEQKSPVVLKQIPEYRYDKLGNVTDTIKNQAVPGIHFVPFDSEEMKQLSVIAPHLNKTKNGVEAEIPVILLREPGLKKKEVRLCVEISSSPDYFTGQKKYLSKTIIISDKLVKPSKWDWIIDYQYTRYSIGKHKFMMETLNEVIDNQWLEQPDAVIFFKITKCKKALYEFNANQANKDSKKAPLRENPDDPKSKIVKF